MSTVVINGTGKFVSSESPFPRDSEKGDRADDSTRQTLVGMGVLCAGKGT